MATYKVVNLMTDQVIACPVYRANSFFQRMQGLLGRSAMKDGEGLYISKCHSIHTFFMKFSIDIIFIDKEFRVKKVITCLKPFRLAFGSFGTAGTLELPSRSINKNPCRPGDQLDFVVI
ncbi:MAG: DUF192 domain-containing protein [Desulfobacteraceae bacterium]|jgi:uncharacterized membrane protein (UPF0127 family)|nr:DUF192 domain-containing protein [Desulfobacteraceae bacterium]